MWRTVDTTIKMRYPASILPHSNRVKCGRREHESGEVPLKSGPKPSTPRVDLYQYKRSC